MTGTTVRSRTGQQAGATVRVGAIGLGAHALRSHIGPLQGIDGCEMVAVSDIEPQALDPFVGVAVRYTDAQNLIDDPNVAAVIVATPDRFHADTLVRCVAAGKHCLVEKPLADQASDLDKVREALAAADELGLVVTSCHPRRLDPPFVALKARMGDLTGRFGPLLDVHFDFAYHVPSKHGLHRGLLLDHANHEIDLVSFLAGPCSFVAHRLYDSETRYALAGAREDGITFKFHGTRTLDARRYAELIRLRFERGEIEVDCETGQVTTICWETMTRTLQHGPATDYQERFDATNRNFIDAIRGEAASYLTARDLLVNTEIGIHLTDRGVYRHDHQPA